MKSKLDIYQLTSAGDREINQDCMVHRVGDDYGLFVVADGLGGHHAGEKASHFFCHGMIASADKYLALVKDHPVVGLTAWIDDAIENMKKMFDRDPWASRAHTTCAILYLDNKQSVTAHCGDSRIYRMNARGVVWRTRDHSVPQQLLEQGKITEEQVGMHPDQNRLTRSINIRNMHSVDIQTYPPIDLGETFLLCSDGFWEYLKEMDLLCLAQKESGKAELNKIAKLAVLRAQGKSDNVTVQWVRGVK